MYGRLMTNTSRTTATRPGRPNSATRRRILATILAHHGNTCAVKGCERVTIVGGAPTDGYTFNLGHVKSDASGGTWTTDNLLPICRRCNKAMGDRDWPVSLMARTPVALPLLPDPGTGETNMEPGPLG